MKKLPAVKKEKVSVWSVSAENFILWYVVDSLLCLQQILDDPCWHRKTSKAPRYTRGILVKFLRWHYRESFEGSTLNRNIQRQKSDAVVLKYVWTARSQTSNKPWEVIRCPTSATASRPTFKRRRNSEIFVRLWLARWSTESSHSWADQNASKIFHLWQLH